ncbi:uncharacterized protein PHALS_10138 [Plasmopara halstedii]|uniref:Uncharacterized protein n=1 Tax=Plasmopara halstedii TaxID=4781 RepID=A0A0P1AFX4_PLAHL|nr:uncharacterized protein PHALS_10138 [Plasmopara halstedii]CEG39911.1 hypothetical protein PHALS_10138 [Plasmopara halstedii]|eukprot:XP_024576280.1 hypothetical protein PHALS_10138 [Plasmopara halstedii]
MFLPPSPVYRLWHNIDANYLASVSDTIPGDELAKLLKFFAKSDLNRDLRFRAKR